MKKFQIFLTLFFFAVCFVFACIHPSKANLRQTQIEGTSLFLATKHLSRNGKNITCYRLLDGRGKIIQDWVADNFDNPFCNCRGLVFIGKQRGQMELFDCRNGQRIPVLTKKYLDEIGCVLDELRSRYDDENLVIINMHKKDIVGFMGKQTLVYNLKTAKLSSFIN